MEGGGAATDGATPAADDLLDSEPPCFNEFHACMAGFIIKGMQQANKGMWLQGLVFFKAARTGLAEGSATPEDMELFSARCSNFAASDFPDEFKDISKQDAHVGLPLENALLKFFCSLFEAQTLAQLGRCGDAAEAYTHVEKAKAYFDNADSVGVTETLNERVSFRSAVVKIEILFGSANYGGALQLIQLGLDSYAATVDALMARGSILCQKGRCECAMGLFDDAIGTLKEAETAQKAVVALQKGRPYEEGDDTDEVIAAIRQSMADAYLQSYRLPMALGLLKQTLACRRPLLGIHHPSTVETAVALGHIFFKQFNIAKAVAAYDDAMELLVTPELVSSLGTDSLLMATCQMCKADCLRGLARFDEAKNLYSAALRIRKLFCGDLKHPLCAEVSEANAVNMFLRARTYASAEPAINQCMEVCKTMLGDKHPQFGRALLRKGCILRDTSAFADATLVLENCLAIYVATYGEGSWPTTEAREALVSVKISQGSYESARADINSILNSRKIFFGQISEHKANAENHPEVVSLHLFQAEIDRLTGMENIETLNALVDKAVSAYVKSPYLGKNHPRTIAAKAEKCFLKHKLASTVATRHHGYLKLRSLVEMLIEKGYCDDHPWILRYRIEEGEYPPNLDPGNPYEDDDEEPGEAGADVLEVDTATIGGSEDRDAGGAAAVVGSGSGEIEGCDDGGADPKANDPPDLSVSKYLYMQGKKLLFQGDLKSAKTLFEQCHSHRQRTFGNNEVAIFALLYIAEVEFRMGRYRESDHLFHQCIDEFTVVCGAKSLQVAEALHRIGLNFYVLGNFKAANEKLDNAMKLRKQLLSGSSKDLATSMHCIGLLKLDQHVMDDASTLFTKSYQIRKQKFGDGHLDVAESFLAKALIFERQARYNDALNSIVSANSIRERVVGETAVNTLTADCQILRSRVSMRMGSYELAIAQCSSAHDIYLQLLGDSHPRTWSALHLKAELLHIMGNVIESRKQFEVLLEKRIALFGENHVSVADTVFGIAENLRELAQYELAEGHYKSAMNMMQMEYSERHPKILSCQFGVAECYRAVGEIGKAKALHDKVKRNRQDMLGKLHPDYLACVQVAVDLKIRVNGEQVDAENQLKMLLQSKKKILGDEHPDTADALNSLGEFHRLNHRYSEANVAYDEALFIKLKTVGDKHPRTIEIINNMALRNATFRVKNVALEKQKSLLEESKSFVKEQELERQRSQESRLENLPEDNPFQSFDEPEGPMPTAMSQPTSTEFVDESKMKLTLRVRRIEAGGLRKAELMGKNDPYIALSIDKPFSWQGRTVARADHGADAVWQYEDTDEHQMVIHSTIDQLKGALMFLAVLDENSGGTDKPIGNCEMDLIGAIPVDKMQRKGETVITLKIFNKKGKESGTISITFGTCFDDLPLTAEEEAAAAAAERERLGGGSEDEDESTMSHTMSMSRIPIFDNSDFKKSIDDLNGCVRVLEKVYSSSERYGSENSSVHPLIANLKGNIGIVEKLEAEAKEQFIERLSKEEKRLFLAAEEALKLRELESNEDEIVFEPGQKAIHEAVVYFEHFCLVESHYWREKFRAVAEKGSDMGDDTVRQAEALLSNAVKNMQRSLISNAYSEYEESNKVLITDPRKAAQGHMLVALAQQGMAKCLSYMCKFDEAKVLYESSVAMQRKLCPDDDEMVAGILFDLAEAQRQCGSYGDAVKTMVESLEVRKKLRIKADKTNEQPSVVELQSMLAVANLHLESGLFIKGMQLCNEVVEIAKSYSHPIPLELANAYVVQAKLFIQLARFVQAYSSIDKAHNLRKKVYWKKDHLDIAECFHIKSQLLLLHKVDNMNALRLSNMALLMRKRCIIASLTVLDDYEIAAQLAATYEEEKAAAAAVEAKEADKSEDSADPRSEQTPATDVKESKSVAAPLQLQRPPVDDPDQPLPEHSLVVDSLLWKGRCQYEMGKYPAAMELFEQALNMNNIIFNADHYMSGVIKFHMAETNHTVAAFKDAHEGYLFSRAAMLKQYGEKSIPAVEVACALASNYRAVSKFADSLEVLNKIYPLAIDLVTESHPLVGRICYSMAEAYLDQGNFERSRGYFERALAIRQGALLDHNSSHPLVAISFFGLAECLRVSGFYTEAGVQYDKAYMMIVTKYGDSHPTTARIAHGLSTHKRVIGNYISAKVSYETAMVSRRDTFGKNHVITAESLLGIGYNLYDQGMSKAADPYLRKALQVISDKVLSEIYDGSPYHSLIADALYACAENARALADYKAAETLYGRVLEHRYALYGDDHFLTQMANCGLAEVYRVTERWEDATQLNKSLLDKLQRVLGEEDKRVAKVMMHTAHVLECKGQYPLSKGLHERAYQMLGRILGSNHSETARALFSLARLSRILGKLDVSKAQHDVAMKSKKMAFSGLQADIARSYAGMGETYLAMGLYDMAYILFLKAVCIQKQQLGDKHPDLFASQIGLAEVLRFLGRVCDNKTVIKEHEELYGGQYIESSDGAEGCVPEEGRKLEDAGPEVPPEVRELELQCEYQLDAYAMYMVGLQNASRCLGPANLLVAVASLGLTRCLCDMGRFREASVLCRDVLKMQRRLVGDEHTIIIATLAQQAYVLLQWGRIYPIEEVPVFNAEIAEESVSSLRQESTSDLSLGWAVHSTRALSAAKGGFTWKHGYCNKEKPGVPGGYMGYQYPNRPAIKRESAFDDNLIVKSHPINTIEEFQSSRNINDPYSISIQDDKFLEFVSEPLTGDAEKLIEVGLELAYKKYPPTGEHPDTSTLLLLKAAVHRARGLRAPAKKAYAQALAMRQRLLAPGHPAIAEVLLGIAENALVGGDIESASMNFNKSLLFRQKALGRNHISIAENLLGMSSICLYQGRIDDARNLAMEALSLRVKLLHKAHYLVANASQVLGSILLATGSEIEEARIMFKNAIDIKIKTFGQFHFEVCLCCNDYALVLLKLQRYDEALEIFQDAYKVQRRLFGDLHPDIATTIHNQASVLLEIGDYLNAEKLYLESLAMKRELYGFEHPLVATALHNMAGLYQLMDKLDSAYKLYVEALSIRTRTFGEVHASVAETQNNLGLLSFAQGRYNDSINEFEKALAIKRRIFPPKHSSVASTLGNLACVHYSMQDFNAAEKLYAECLSIRESILGPDHPDTLSCRQSLDGLDKTRSEVLPGRITMSQTVKPGQTLHAAHTHDKGEKSGGNDVCGRTL